MALRKWEISKENSIVMRGPGERGMWAQCVGGVCFLLWGKFRERERYVGRICMSLDDDVSIKLTPVTFKGA